MTDSLEEITNIEEPEVKGAKDRFSGMLSAGAALFILADACYLYYTQKYMGGARSLFQEIGISQETNYTSQLALDIFYIAFFGAKSIFYLL